MTDSVPAQFPDVKLFWEIDFNNHLTIAITAPISYLTRFGSPSDLIYQFLGVLQARGIDLANTESARTRINKEKGTFLVRWSGHVHTNPELVPEIMPALTQNLGVRTYGG
jgi:prephenate dehydratase